MNRFTSFLAGAVVAAGIGYYKVHQDLWKTSRIIEEEVRQSRDLLKHQNIDLDKRVSELQKQLNELQRNEQDLFTHIKILHQRLDHEISALREQQESHETKPKKVKEEKQIESQPKQVDVEKPKETQQNEKISQQENIQQK